MFKYFASSICFLSLSSLKSRIPRKKSFRSTQENYKIWVIRILSSVRVPIIRLERKFLIWVFFSYYVMLEGFLYHTDLNETMMPVELCKAPYLRKKDGEKNILFVQNAACIRTYKIAKVMKEEGYKVYLLYTLAPPYAAYEEFADIYEDIWGFSSANGILDFISNSDFDIVHCSNEPDILVNIVQRSNKPVVADTHDMQSIRRDTDFDALVLEYLANVNSDGVMYTSAYGANIAKDKYRLE